MPRPRLGRERGRLLTRRGWVLASVVATALVLFGLRFAHTWSHLT
jgi:hypothetical protein